MKSQARRWQARGGEGSPLLLALDDSLSCTPRSDRTESLAVPAVRRRAWVVLRRLTGSNLTRGDVRARSATRRGRVARAVRPGSCPEPSWSLRTTIVPPTMTLLDGLQAGPPRSGRAAKELLERFAGRARGVRVAALHRRVPPGSVRDPTCLLIDLCRRHAVYADIGQRRVDALNVHRRANKRGAWCLLERLGMDA
jgi:hypothetical protein